MQATIDLKRKAAVSQYCTKGAVEHWEKLSTVEGLSKKYGVRTSGEVVTLMEDANFGPADGYELLEDLLKQRDDLTMLLGPWYFRHAVNLTDEELDDMTPMGMYKHAMYNMWAALEGAIADQYGMLPHEFELVLRAQRRLNKKGKGKRLPKSLTKAIRDGAKARAMSRALGELV